jgi:DNA-binding HxlR family transcriptional regulator
MPRVYDQPSPIARTLEVVGDRWTILILQDLLRGYHRFVELKESVKGVPTNILSGRLRLLERHGIVWRRIYNEHPLRAEYHLTRKGHELGIVAGALATWGDKHMSDDIVLVHAACGFPMQVVYYCISCKTQVPGAQVRLVDRDSTQDKPTDKATNCA